ncbi:MgtC/SapB family protein [Allosphingosinicella flava]|uniref:Protein MgtC n=1 Tax=Allosphingosinicella flava TaxID=2771430 RepID=A0A7T2GI40_9SPHN|nr:MgtC/SapB family protein [Sphingosinicella flava]QPQ54301.1 MgtC/SapB family protein [Sphingosinicella flava]
MTENSFALQSLTLSEFALRMGAATLLPFLIGLERFLRRKPIDFRPFVIIAVGACGLAIGALEIMAGTADPQASIDPSRVFEGVITGIGFLGAGAMFRRGGFVQGAGSASAIWAAGAIGLICGFGELLLAATMTAIILILLIVSGPFTEEWDPEAHPEEAKDMDATVGGHS